MVRITNGGGGTAEFDTAGGGGASTDQELTDREQRLRDRLMDTSTEQQDTQEQTQDELTERQRRLRDRLMQFSGGATTAEAVATEDGKIDVEQTTRKQERLKERLTEFSEQEQAAEPAKTEVVLDRSGGGMATPRFVTPAQKKRLEQKKQEQERDLAPDAVVIPPGEGRTQIAGPGADPTTLAEATGVSEFEQAQGLEARPSIGQQFRTTVGGREITGTRSEIAKEIEKEWLEQNPQFSAADIRVIRTDQGFQTRLTQSGAQTALKEARTQAGEEFGQTAFQIQRAPGGPQVKFTETGQQTAEDIARREAAEQIEQQLAGASPEQVALAGKLGATPSDIEELRGLDIDIGPEDIRRQGDQWVLSSSGLAAVGAARFQQQGLDVTEEDVQVADGQVSLESAANRRIAADQLSQQTGQNISTSDIVRTDQGWELSENAQKRIVAERFSNQTGTTIAPNEVVRTDQGWRLSEEAERERVTNQFRQETGMAIAASDVRRTDEGWKLSDDAQKRFAARQLSDELGFTVIPEDLTKDEEGNWTLDTEGVTPHVQTVANQQALVLRARRERGIEETVGDVTERVRGEVGEFAESPFGYAVGLLSSGGVTTGEAAALTFSAGEQVERAGIELGEDITTGLVEGGQEATEFVFGTADPLGAPTVAGQTLGEAGASAIGMATTVPFQLAGAATQFPVTAGMDIQATDVEVTGDTPATRRVRFTQEEPTPGAAAGGVSGSFVRGGERTVEYFKERPLEAALLFAPVGISAARGGGGALARGTGPVGRAAGRVPRPGISRFAVGEGAGRSVVLRTTEGKVATERPLVTARRGAPGRAVEAGTPKVRLTEEPITPELTPAETRGLVRRLQETEPSPEVAQTIRELGREPRLPESQRVQAFRETQRQTQFSELQPKELESTIGDVLESHGVPRGAARDVVQAVKADEGAVYGSVTQRAAAERVGEPGVLRTPRDIDIADVPSKTRFAEQITRKINERAGYEVVELRDGTPTSKITGEKLFDIHEAEVPTSESTAVTGEEIFGVRREPDVLTAEGLRTITLSEQTARKGSGAMFQITREPRTVGELTSRITPEHPGRLKDIADFYSGERANIRALEIRGQTRRATRARENLEAFVESFGEDIASRVRTQYEQGTTPAVRLASFEQPSRPSTISGALESRAVSPVSRPSADVSIPSVSPSAAVSRPSRPSRPSPSLSLSVSRPSVGSLGLSRPSASVRSAVDSRVSAVDSSFAYPSLSVGTSVSVGPSGISTPSVSVPSTPSTPVDSRGFDYSIAPLGSVPSRPASPLRRDEEEPSPSREREQPPEEPGVSPLQQLDVGWLAETQLGFAGVDVSEVVEQTGQQELEAEAAELGGFTFELLPTLTAEEAEELQATQEFLFSR